MGEAELEPGEVVASDLVAVSSYGDEGDGADDERELFLPIRWSAVATWPNCKMVPCHSSGRPCECWSASNACWAIGLEVNIGTPVEQ